MSHNSLKGAVLGAGLVAALSLTAGAAPASAACKLHPHAATATGYLKSWTGVEARAAWRLKVLDHDGVTYALWVNAKNRSTACLKHGNKWSCTAWGRPCN
jgi:hypothetical protein